MAAKVAFFILVAIATISTIVTVTVASSTSRNVVDSLRVGPNIEVTLSQLEDGSSLQDGGPGIVHGLRTCGGQGQLLQMRYETCSGEPDQICKVPGDNNLRRAEIHFVSSDDISSLAVRVVVSTSGIPPTVIFDRGLENSAVNRGAKYSINADVGASPMFRGRAITIKFELYRQSDNVVEICSLADFEII